MAERRLTELLKATVERLWAETRELLDDSQVYCQVAGGVFRLRVERQVLGRAHVVYRDGGRSLFALMEPLHRWAQARRVEV